MDGVVCINCSSWLSVNEASCPACGAGIVLNGESKNVIDHIQANCLINRYDGSDLLEHAVILKEGKSNLKVATRLMEYNTPLTVSKQKVFAFDQSLLSSIQALRNERTAAINRYEQLIQSNWKMLQTYPFKKET